MLNNQENNFEEENFAELFAQYTSDEDIEQSKREEDEEEFKQFKKAHSTESKYPITIAISIKDYVEKYLGIQTLPCIETIERKKYKKGKVVETKTVTRVKYDTLWHRGLKDIGSPFVIGVDNEYANKNPDRVYDGELLIVIDAKGNRGTYVNPAFLAQLIESEELEKELKRLKKTGVHELEKLGEYIEMCSELQRQHDAVVEQNTKLMELLKETHKIKKFKQLKKEIKHD